MGNEGYGIYWRLLEMLCSNYDGESTLFEFTTGRVKAQIGCRTTTKLALIADIMTTQCSISVTLKKDTVVFDAPILSNLKDRDFKKSRKDRAKYALDKNRIDKNRIEENRIDKSVTKSGAKTAPKIDYQFYMDNWNNYLGELLTPIKMLTPKRKTMIRTLLKNYPDFNLLEYFEIIKGSDFLMGSNSDWRAGFDWVFKHSNYLKVIEGKYNNNTNRKSTAQIKQDNMLNILKEYENEDRASNN
jgi:hypothetical protein